MIEASLRDFIEGSHDALAQQGQAVVLSDTDVDLLLGDELIASWAWDVAQRFAVSPRRAVRLLASALASFGQAVGGPLEPMVDVG